MRAQLLAEVEHLSAEITTIDHQVADLIQREISVLIQRELKDPRLGFVTITSVEVSPDLRHARVFYSVMGTPEELAALRAERGGGRASGTDRPDSAALSSPITASLQIVGRRRDEVPTGSPADAPGSTPTDTHEEDHP